MMSTISPGFSCEPGLTTHDPPSETGFTSWDISHLFSFLDSSSTNIIPDSAQEYISPGSVNRTGSNVDPTDCTDERRKKRKLSNRESAKRSRVKKQKHLEEMRIQLNQLKIQNQELKNQLSTFITIVSEQSWRMIVYVRSTVRMLHDALLNIRQLLMLRQIERSSYCATWSYDNSTVVTVQQDPLFITNYNM